MDACYVVFIHKCPDLRRTFLIDAGSDLLVTLLQICSLLPNPRRILFEDFSQHIGNTVNILLRLFQFVRIQINVLHTGRGCQNIHIPVVDIAPLGRDCRGSGLIAQCLRRIIVVLNYHELIKLRHNRQKRQNSQHHRHPHDTLMLAGICPESACFPGPFHIFSHIPPAFP